MSNKKLIGILVFLFFGLILFFYCFIPKPSLVFIDMQKIMAQPAALLAKTDLSPTTQQHVLKRYAAYLPEVIKQYGDAHQVTIISASVVSNQGRQDISDFIIAETLAQVRKNA